MCFTSVVFRIKLKESVCRSFNTTYELKTRNVLKIDVKNAPRLYSKIFRVMKNQYIF